ncbi:MAG: monovalent cation/H(+) antiporter subunit G, partial [Nitrososphaerales archaeon]|nr:monovalent cation/H(+) antiporter subunit G [Nitrososphaerales archaeon]
MVILEIVSYVVMIAGLFCSTIGSIGLLRFPDIYTRIHAANVTIIGGVLLLSSGAALFMLTSNILFSIKAIVVAAIIFVT